MRLLETMSARYTCPKLDRFTENRSVVGKVIFDVLARNLFVVSFENILPLSTRFVTVSINQVTHRG